MGSAAGNAVKWNGLLIPIVPGNVYGRGRVRVRADLRNDEMPLVCITIVAGEVVYVDCLIRRHLWRKHRAGGLGCYHRHGWWVWRPDCGGFLFGCGLRLCSGDLGRFSRNYRVHVGFAGNYGNGRRRADRLNGCGVV
jgi:hypothetical protein